MTAPDTAEFERRHARWAELQRDLGPIRSFSYAWRLPELARRAGGDARFRAALALAQTLVAMGRHGEALAALPNPTETPPPALAARLLYCRACALAATDVESARACFSAALPRWPDRLAALAAAAHFAFVSDTPDPGAGDAYLAAAREARSLSDLTNRSENSAGRGQFLTISPGNSRTIAQESGKKWTMQTDSQPISLQARHTPGDEEHLARAHLLAEWSRPDSVVPAAIHGGMAWLRQHHPADAAEAEALHAEARFRVAPADALVWLDQALELGEKYGQHQFKARLLKRKAQALEAAGQLADARRFFEYAEKTAHTQGNSSGFDL